MLVKLLERIFSSVIFLLYIYFWLSIPALELRTNEVTNICIFFFIMHSIYQVNYTWSKFSKSLILSSIIMFLLVITSTLLKKFNLEVCNNFFEANTVLTIASILCPVVTYAILLVFVKKADYFKDLTLYSISYSLILPLCCIVTLFDSSYLGKQLLTAMTYIMLPQFIREFIEGYIKSNRGKFKEIILTHFNKKLIATTLLSIVFILIMLLPVGVGPAGVIKNTVLPIIKIAGGSAGLYVAWQMADYVWIERGTREALFPTFFKKPLAAGQASPVTINVFAANTLELGQPVIASPATSKSIPGQTPASSAAHAINTHSNVDTVTSKNMHNVYQTLRDGALQFTKKIDQKGLMHKITPQNYFQLILEIIKKQKIDLPFHNAVSYASSTLFTVLVFKGNLTDPSSLRYFMLDGPTVEAALVIETSSLDFCNTILRHVAGSIKSTLTILRVDTVPISGEHLLSMNNHITKVDPEAFRRYGIISESDWQEAKLKVHFKNTLVAVVEIKPKMKPPAPPTDPSLDGGTHWAWWLLYSGFILVGLGLTGGIAIYVTS